MSEMVERVARAIEEALGLDDSWQTVARAAIAAMREPTEAMLKVDTRDWGTIDTYMEKNDMVWREMIDAALKD